MKLNWTHQVKSKIERARRATQEQRHITEMLQWQSVALISFAGFRGPINFFWSLLFSSSSQPPLIIFFISAIKVSGFSVRKPLLLPDYSTTVDLPRSQSHDHPHRNQILIYIPSLPDSSTAVDLPRSQSHDLPNTCASASILPNLLQSICSHEHDPPIAIKPDNPHLLIVK